MGEVRFVTREEMLQAKHGLRKPEESVVSRALPDRSEVVHYEPGNGTRYVVQLTALPEGTPFCTQYILSVVNMHRSMELWRPMDENDLGYMEEKLGLGRGDCVALLQLANEFIRRPQ
jgi:hypothetical protein